MDTGIYVYIDTKEDRKMINTYTKKDKKIDTCIICFSKFVLAQKMITQQEKKVFKPFRSYSHCWKINLNFQTSSFALCIAIFYYISF